MTDAPPPLRDRRCVVTGASRGIGAAIARRFAEAGAALGLIARTGTDLDALAAELTARGTRVVTATADVSVPAEVARAAAAIRERLGPIDLLVNNAGIVLRKATAEITDAEWRYQLAVNLDGPFYVTRAFADDLRARRGRIINLASIAGRQGTPLLASYCAAKHGVVGLTRALAEEWRGVVTVNAICPGSVDTDMLRTGHPGARPAMTADDGDLACVDETLDPAGLARLAIFPLPNAVLLPGGLMPLHVFEPRYRDLVHDALAGDRLLAIARLCPGYEADYQGRPAVHACCGVGRIIASEETGDGRFLLVLRGLGRVVIEREHAPAHAYRQVAARLLTDGQSARPEATARLHGQLVALCERLALALDRGGEQLRALVGDCHEPGACADAIAAALVIDHCERQILLEALDPADRLDRVVEHVSRLLCQLVPCDGPAN